MQKQPLNCLVNCRIFWLLYIVYRIAVIYQNLLSRMIPWKLVLQYNRQHLGQTYVFQHIDVNLIIKDQFVSDFVLVLM